MSLFLLTQPTILTILAGVFGLAIGSFLNVVIYRLPLMMQNEWRAQCLEFLHLPAENMQDLSLIRPRSHCPQCKNVIRWWSNIPLLSFIFQRGKCVDCKTAISWRYPLIELGTGLVSAFIVYRFGVGWNTLYLLVLTWTLIALIFIDFAHQILPDQMTLPLLWIGLLANAFGVFTDTTSAIIGAMLGYLSLWIFAKLFELLRKREGMGHGDFKLFAAFGAWLGWQGLLPVILFASLLGTLVGVSLLFFKKAQRETPLAFGPYLAIAGWVMLVWGDSITAWYRHLWS